MTPVALPPGLRPGGRFDAWVPTAPAYVVADVDGTLVGPAHRAADEVEDAVRRAQAAGLDVGFATGRMRLAVEPLWAQLRANGPHVLHNGAEVRAGGRTIASWPLTPEQVDAMLAVGRDLDVYLEIYVPDGFLVSRWDEAARPHWEILGHEPLGIVDRARSLDDEVLKVTFAVFDGGPDRVVRAIEEAGLRAGAAGSPLTPEIDYVNGTHPDADKGAALRAAAAHRGVEMARVVAIGDAANDLPMLSVAGTAIAMGQAPDRVQEAAHLVVPEVDAHGVAHALDACLAWRD